MKKRKTTKTKINMEMKKNIIGAHMLLNWTGLLVVPETNNNRNHIFFNTTTSVQSMYIM